MCFGCHQILGSNPEDHRLIFLKRLGQQKYDALTIRAKTPQKVDEKSICLGLTLQLQEMGVLRDKNAPRIVYRPTPGMT